MRYFFVDTENIGEYNFVKEMNVSSGDTIVLFVSEKSQRIKLEDLRLINLSGAKIVYEDVYTGYTNALDFQLVACMSLTISTANEEDEYIVVSNDNDYKMPVKYLSEKTNRNISVLKTKTLAEGICDEVNVSVSLAEVMAEDIAEVSKEINFRDDILNIIEQSKALNKLHNNLKNKFGNEEGRKIYMKLKPHIKSLYKAV